MHWIMAVVGALVGMETRSAAELPEPVEVMVVGTYHFDSPGLDLNNPEVDDVLKPERQRELGALSTALAEFRPTKILVERVAKTTDLVDSSYAEFTTDELGRNRDERVQIAYRLARQLGHRTVYAIDEQPSAGEPDYFPFGKLVEWAEANDAKAELNNLLAKGAAISARIEQLQKGSIPAALADLNTSEAAERDHAFYYEALAFGDTEQQPGADLNAMWYLRNAKIFAKLGKVASPGDRVLVIYGTGHNYWLRHFAKTAPGYRSVDPVPYLNRAAAAVR